MRRTDAHMKPGRQLMLRQAGARRRMPDPLATVSRRTDCITFRGFCSFLRYVREGFYDCDQEFVRVLSYGFPYECGVS